MDSESKKSKVGMSVARVKSAGSVAGKSSANIPGKSLSRMKIRKQSYGFGNVPGIKAAERRSSQIAVAEYKRPPVLFLNTYQLEPRVRFHVPRVVKAIDEVLDLYFTEHKYSASESPALTMHIAGEVMRNVKGMGFNRYRIISVVTIVQKRAQSYNNAVAFLWDHERDSIANVVREVTTAFIQATVFGVYLD